MAGPTEPRSAACVASPAGITDGGGTEWFVPGGGHDRRAVRVGEHLPLDHPLVLAWPDNFTPSAEPVDTWPVGTPSAETRKRQQAEQLRLASHPARRITPVCARCGAESETSVVLFDQPTQLDLISELSALDDGDPASHTERWRIEAHYAAMARAAQAQAIELQHAEGEWRSQHRWCEEGTPPMPEPQAPEHPALTYRSSRVRTLA